MYFTYFFACLGGALKLKKHLFLGYNPLAGTSTNSNPPKPSKTPHIPHILPPPILFLTPFQYPQLSPHSLLSHPPKSHLSFFTSNPPKI